MLLLLRWSGGFGHPGIPRDSEGAQGAHGDVALENERVGRGREGEFPKAVFEEGWWEQRRRRRSRVDFDAVPHRGAEDDWLARGVG